VVCKRRGTCLSELISGVPFQPRSLDSVQAESSAAADLSSLVNHAFKTLQNPVLRAEYILQGQGVDLAESEQTLEDPGLLMEIMESREALDEATSQEQVDVIVSETQGPFILRWCMLEPDGCICRRDE